MQELLDNIAAAKELEETIGRQRGILSERIHELLKEALPEGSLVDKHGAIYIRGWRVIIRPPNNIDQTWKVWAIREWWKGSEPMEE